MKINKKGFTLIEMLAVVLIIGVLAAVAVPTYMKAIEKSKATEAIQALSDIAKAENDYYNAKTRYTKDFSDMSISVFGDDAEGTNYENQNFSYTLEIDTALAERKIAEDAYTLYRYFDDPRTYCQPEGNKYCKILGLPVGNRNSSIGNWQSCPGGVYPCTLSCTRETTLGYDCEGTYNEDGSFTEKVCDSNNGMCLITQYEEGNTECGSVRTSCLSYDENGRCTRGTESTYNENCQVVGAHKCTAWAEDGSCTAGTGGEFNVYDENGNMIGKSQCDIWGSNGECLDRGSYAWIYTYDENGNETSYTVCGADNWNGDGTCSVYGHGGFVKTYDENGNAITYRECESWSANGVCDNFRNNGRVSVYDENGNEISTINCTSWSDDSTCASYGNGTVYTYDENGNQTSYASCESWNSNGTCATYGNYGELYTYDSNGNMLTYIECSNWNNNGTCATYGEGMVANYDSNGNVTSERSCESWNVNGSCETYGDYGGVYTYDSHGNMLSYRECLSFNGDGFCETYGGAYSSSTYDSNGNLTGMSSRECYNEDCTEGYEWGYDFILDEYGYPVSEDYYSNYFGSHESTYSSTNYCFPSDSSDIHAEGYGVCYGGLGFDD